jgi:hypothetical protein
MRIGGTTRTRAAISRHHSVVRFGLVFVCFIAACNAKPAPVAAKDDAPAPTAEPAASAPAADKAAIPELSEEDKRLLAADPKSLTPEERRKRAYALRRKIMQNPDSPAARTLEDLRRATEAGQLDPTRSGMQFQARTADGQPTTPPPGTMGPAGARPKDPADGANEPAPSSEPAPSGAP